MENVPTMSACSPVTRININIVLYSDILKPKIGHISTFLTIAEAVIS